MTHQINVLAIHFYYFIWSFIITDETSVVSPLDVFRRHPISHIVVIGSIFDVNYAEVIETVIVFPCSAWGNSFVVVGPGRLKKTYLLD